MGGGVSEKRPPSCIAALLFFAPGEFLKTTFKPRWPRRGTRIISTQMKDGYEPPSMSLKGSNLMNANLSLQDQARYFVMVYINEEREAVQLPRIRFTEDQVYLVWFAKTLQNWKALVATSFFDGKYYEVTHNGDKNETYVDEYVKVNNACFPDPQPSHVQERLV